MKLKELRKARGLTQKELGDKIGRTDRAISNYENGCRRPDAPTLRRIAHALGVRMDDIELPCYEDEECEFSRSA